MELKNIPECARFAYIKKCPYCYIEQKILTQHDNFPEYHTEVFLKCQCGEYIEFILPVN
jgi:hypothetical protein